MLILVAVLLTNLVCGQQLRFSSTTTYVHLLVAGSFSWLHFKECAYTLHAIAQLLEHSFTSKCFNFLSIFIYAVLVHDHFCIPTCAKCLYIIVAVLSSLPLSDSLSLTSGYWSFMFPCLHCAWAPDDSNNLLHNLCTVTCNNTCLPHIHNTRLYWALPYQCWSKVCHVHVVLSTLCLLKQEKMVTEQEVEDLKPDVRPWSRLVEIQCTKPADVARKTAELLAELGHGKEGKHLKGQWVNCVSLLLFCCSVVFTMNRQNW